MTRTPISATTGAWTATNSAGFNLPGAAWRAAVTVSSATRHAAVTPIAGLFMCSHQKRIGPSFLPDRRRRAVARMDGRRIRKPEQHIPNRAHQRIVIARRQIGAADRSREQRVADEQFLLLP